MDHVNKTVLKFLKKNDLEDFADDWLSSELQMNLVGLVDTSASTESKRGGKSKKKKDPNAPKRNKTSYIFFSIHERPNLPEGLSAKESVEEIALRWNKVKQNPKEMEKYIKLAAEDKERYAREMSEYEAK